MSVTWNVLAALLALVLGIGIGLLLALVYFQRWRARYTDAIRQDAIQRSHAVTVGKVHEQLIPYLPEFQFNPKDARFLGTPVDLVVFDGLDEGQLRRVVFIEVKTGGATLNVRERQVRDAVQARQVDWIELRVARGGE
ncbi:MAG: hypothetical protein AUH06_01715 [Gemmatimonadetes bacterium 13_2_20CM_69_27]|nr:MAG: hypothetical protein AUH06_01715 [Gemmatimonadetes bacterium 13_2_20CM_69_27]OLB59837.1 MAG: hypothetical protein AUI13_02450 [Gemmatimonadetes bacterium 13_2_20CM_2_69_23]OLD58515.1 MAG: hypothetical protein AUF60_09585 [Gemmatimonadetes bacterium 13_1_20CM_69_28]